MTRLSASATLEPPAQAPAPAQLPTHLVDSAVRLSCAQAMLGAVYGASTGGMFLIGYALKLHASHVQIGLMSTIPMLCVLAQLGSAALIERGISRRKLTVAAALANVSGWALVILLPYITPADATQGRLAMLIGTITLVTLFGHLSGNARASWVGDLIPAGRRGRFFGRLTLYGGLIAMVFAILEGLFLDWTSSMGLAAFGCLFGFGMLFGLANALLFLPQADVPLLHRHQREPFLSMIRGTFSNRPLMAVMLYDITRWLTTIAAPFYNTYMLEKMGMPFLGIGLISAAFMLTMLFSGPFWGRIVDRYGCRPVLVACTFCLVPAPLLWMFVSSPKWVYLVFIPVNLAQGLAAGGVAVAIQTLIYKVIPPASRSVQLAVYTIIVVLAVAPMPALGGSLPQWLQALPKHVPLPQWLASLLLAADLRATFYLAGFFMFLAALVARFIHEPGSHRTRQMLRRLPGHLGLTDDLPKAA